MRIRAQRICKVVMKARMSKVIRNIDVLAKILKLNANICGSSLINIRRVRVRRVDLADDHPLPARSRSRWRSIARGTPGGGEQL